MNVSSVLHLTIIYEKVKDKVTKKKNVTKYDDNNYCMCVCLCEKMQHHRTHTVCILRMTNAKEKRLEKIGKKRNFPFFSSSSFFSIYLYTFHKCLHALGDNVYRILAFSAFFFLPCKNVLKNIFNFFLGLKTLRRREFTSLYMLNFFLYCSIDK